MQSANFYLLVGFGQELYVCIIVNKPSYENMQGIVT